MLLALTGVGDIYQSCTRFGTMLRFYTARNTIRCDTFNDLSEEFPTLTYIISVTVLPGRWIYGDAEPSAFHDDPYDAVDDIGRCVRPATMCNVLMHN